jgi:predicted nuclease of restriction endonuclease-like RecB superfamily
MLPSDLLMHWQNGETIVPKKLTIDAKNLAIATELIACFEESRGAIQGELDRQLQELEGDSPDYRLKRGLAHLLKGGFVSLRLLVHWNPIIAGTSVCFLCSVDSQSSTG